MNTKTSNLTSNNSSFFHSVSHETKEHFDSLLKKALYKNDKIPKKGDPKTSQKPYRTKSDGDDIKVVHKDKFEGNENYILEKFLSDAANNREEPKSPFKASELLNSVTVIKPRKHKNIKPTFSLNEEHYSIASPKFNNNEILKDIEKLSISSKNTYDVSESKVVTNKKELEKVTYNINKVNDEDLKHNSRKNSKESSVFRDNDDIIVPVGEIELHNTTVKSLVQVLNKRESSNTSDNISKTSEYSDIKTKNIAGQEELKTDKPKTTVINKIIDETDTISYENEIKGVVHELKRKHRRNRHKSKSKNEISPNEFTYSDLIGVVIYKTDKLYLNSLINQPCVKIHFVNSETGEYLARSREIQEMDTNRTIKFIYPLITKSYNLQQNRSFIPHWDELLVFNDDFNYLLDLHNPVIIFFELLDFMTVSVASANYSRDGAESGWHKIAWAFLMPVSKSGHLNVEQKLRLQLYKPRKYYKKKNTSECTLYDWWSKGHFLKYPSTLHVTIKRVKADILKDTESFLKPDFSIDLAEHEKEVTEVQKEESIPEQFAQPVNWKRMLNQPCKIPNVITEKLKYGKKGCFAVKFSNTGMFLACGIADETKNSILIYYILSLKDEYCKCAGHQGIIYNLCWSSDDKYLLSSSADCTVFIWNIYKKQYYPKQVLPHPSFVYCALFSTEHLQIITGCYDQVIRIWNSMGTIDSEYELHQELCGHSGYVTCLCFGENNKLLYSSDSIGTIIEWSFNKNDWLLKRTFAMKELQKTVINNIVLHPGMTRMVIFCRDNIHRMLDLNIGCVVQWYRSVNNYRVHTNGCLSPCGTLVFAPSEDGTIIIWNADTGVLLATYKPYLNICKDSIVPHCIHFHPLDNMLAISHYGLSVPVLFCEFDNSASGKELQLKDYTESRKSPLRKKNKKKLSPKRTKRRTHTKDSSFNDIIDKMDNVLDSVKHH